MRNTCSFYLSYANHSLIDSSCIKSYTDCAYTVYPSFSNSVDYFSTLKLIFKAFFFSLLRICRKTFTDYPILVRENKMFNQTDIIKVFLGAASTPLKILGTRTVTQRQTQPNCLFEWYSGLKAHDEEAALFN